VTTFSVIIPTRDRAPVLFRAIDSVLAQTFPDFEVIVVDDGSRDDTPLLAGVRSDPRVRYLRQEPQGVAVARNAGSSHAQGRYLVFLDSDDEADTRWLAGFADSIGGADPAVVCCGVIGHGGPDRIEIPRNLGPAFGDQHGLFLAGSFAVRRDLFWLVGGYAPIPYSENTELGLRLASTCASAGWPIRCVEEVLVIVHEDPIETYEKNMARLEGTRYVLAHHTEKLARNPVELANYRAVAGVCAARLGRLGDARRWFAQASSSNPWRARNHARLLVSLLPPVARRVWALSPAAEGTRSGPARSDVRR
jgi:glycosyltransferase involved in cell wall biosynthesis